MASIEEKLEKAEKKLAALQEQKSTLDNKIKKAQEDIEKYNGIISQKKFNAAEEVLRAKGLALDDIMAAIKSGDLTSIQEQIGS